MLRALQAHWTLHLLRLKPARLQVHVGHGGCPALRTLWHQPPNGFRLKPRTNRAVTTDQAATTHLPHTPKQAVSVRGDRQVTLHVPPCAILPRADLYLPSLAQKRVHELHHIVRLIVGKALRNQRSLPGQLRLKPLHGPSQDLQPRVCQSAQHTNSMPVTVPAVRHQPCHDRRNPQEHLHHAVHVARVAKVPQTPQGQIFHQLPATPPNSVGTVNHHSAGRTRCLYTKSRA